MKINRTSNYRVVVYVDDCYMSHSQMLQELQRIKSQIERHVDGCSGRNAYGVQTEYTVEHVCSFCGYRWELDDEGIPCCCDKAIKEFELQEKTKRD